MIRNIWLITLALVFSGCSTAYISSQTDPRYSLSPTFKIALIIPDSSTIEERKVGGIFEAEMKKAGFEIVDLLEADYFLIISTDEKTSQITGSLPVIQTAKVSGYVGSTPYSGKSRYTTYVPYTESYRVKKLYANLYSVADIQQQKFMTVWEGYIGAADDEFERYKRSLIHELLKHFGENYQEHTPIDYSYE